MMVLLEEGEDMIGAILEENMIDYGCSSGRGFDGGFSGGEFDGVSSGGGFHGNNNDCGGNDNSGANNDC
jgi:hypothetical protein